MPCLRSLRLVFNSLALPLLPSLRRPPARPTLRSLCFSFSNSTTTPPCWPSQRAFSTPARSQSDLFDYTSGRWTFNDALRLAERRRVFNVDALCRLAAESVGRGPDDIVGLAKFAEGGFNRTFLITMRDGFQMVARIPYPVTVPKYYAIASEVATMALLRSSGLPVPEVYGYSPTPDNAAETEYIFMEFVQGVELSDIWFDLGEQEIESVLRQLAVLESKMVSIAFPAGGSLYYVRDLAKVTEGLGIALEDARFCVGPDTSLPLWYGRRSQLDVDRGPCMPLPTFIKIQSLGLTDNNRRKHRSGARARSPKGTGLPAAVRSTAVALPTHEEGRLPVPGAAALGPRREPGPLSPHRAVARPQEPCPPSVQHPPSRPLLKQYHRFAVARLRL